jgi:hypothetical protein
MLASSNMQQKYRHTSIYIKKRVNRKCNDRIKTNVRIKRMHDYRNTFNEVLTNQIAPSRSVQFAGNDIVHHSSRVAYPEAPRLYPSYLQTHTYIHVSARERLGE